jgi:hypothetical protein
VWGTRRGAFGVAKYYAVVAETPSWRRPFPRRTKSAVSRSSTRTAGRAQRELVTLGSPEDVAKVLSDRAQMQLNRWVCRDGIRVKIRAVPRWKKFSY